MFHYEHLLQSYTLPPELREFLQLMKAKALLQRKRNGVKTVKLDDAFGILPPLRVDWNPDHPESDGVLTLGSDWDKLQLVFWCAGEHFLAVAATQGNQTIAINPAKIVNATTGNQLFLIVQTRLRLLHSANCNPVFKASNVRNLIQSLLQKKPRYRHLTLELMLVWLSLELTQEEEFKPEAFAARARRELLAVARRRSRFCLQPEFAALAEASVMLSRDELWQNYHDAIGSIWCFLAAPKQKSDSKIRYTFREYYHADGSVTVGELLAVPDDARCEFTHKGKYDCYQEIYPDYDSARVCRELTLQILNEGK